MGCTDVAQYRELKGEYEEQIAMRLKKKVEEETANAAWKAQEEKFRVRPSCSP